MWRRGDEWRRTSKSRTAAEKVENEPRCAMQKELNALRDAARLTDAHQTETSTAAEMHN